MHREHNLGVVTIVFWEKLDTNGSPTANVARLRLIGYLKVEHHRRQVPLCVKKIAGENLWWSSQSFTGK